MKPQNPLFYCIVCFDFVVFFLCPRTVSFRLQLKTMETTEHEGGTGGKLRRRPLRRAPSTPYDRPPVAASRIHFPLPEAEAGGSRWFSKLVDPASRVIASSASRLLSVFGKRLDAPTGADINTIEVVPEMTSSLEVREKGENPIDGSDRSEQELISRADSFSELEQLLKQKRFSRAEIDGLTKLLHSRTIEPSTLPSRDYTNMVKINEDLSIYHSSSQQAVIHQEEEKSNSADLECQMDQMGSLLGNATSRVHANIPEECFNSPIEIARSYMGSKHRKGALYNPGLQSQNCQRDKVFPLNLRLGNELSNAAITSSSAVRYPIFSTDFENDFMSQKPQGRSALYKLSRSPYCRSSMMTNSREMDSNVESTRSLEWTPSKSRISHSDHGKPLKRGSSDRVAGCFGDSWRVRQKLCLNDLNLSTHADTSLTFLLGEHDKHDFDLKGLDNLDDGISSTSVLHVPPQSVEMARKILHQLDKLNPPPQNKSSEKKVFGDASSSKSSLSPSHEGSLKIKANNDSTKSLNVRGSKIFEDPSSSNLARINCSASPNKDLIEGEVSLTPCISGAEVSSCLGKISSVSCASVANRSMKFMDSNSRGFSLVSMQKKEPSVQSAPDAKDEPTKAEHAILASLKEPLEKSFVHSPDYVPASGLMHVDNETKISDKAYTESKISFNLLAARKTNTLSKSPLSSTMATTLVDSATPMKEDSVSLLTFGAKVSTSRLNTGSMSAVSSSTGNGEPKFQFGSVNSSHSFTGVSSALSSNAGSCSLSTSTVFPLSENGGFGVSASSASGSSSLQFAFSSSQNTVRNFVAVAASSCGTQGISSGNGVAKTSHKSLFQFGVLDSQTASGFGSQASCSSQIGFSISGVKPFTSSFSSSSSVSLASSSNRSPGVPANFSTSSSLFLLSSSSSATLGSTGLSSPSARFSFGIPANVSVFAPLVSSRTITPLASIGTATSASFLSTTQLAFDLTTSTLGFGSGSMSNARMIVQDSRDGSNLHATPTAPTVGQPTSLQPVLSQAQVFQFQTYQNNTNPHNPSPF